MTTCSLLTTTISRSTTIAKARFLHGPQIRPATPFDVSPCGILLEQAFSTNVIINHISDSQLKINFWTQVIAFTFSDNKAHLAIAKVMSLSPPVVVGLAKWVFVPENSTLPGLFPSDMDLPREVVDHMADPELGMAFFSDQHARHQKYMGSKAHWYLALIATRPEYKGSGAGRLLMEWGVKMVDEGSHEAYLEASPAGKPLFEKYGFHVEEAAEYLEGRYVECSMIREAMKTE